MDGLRNFWAKVKVCEPIEWEVKEEDRKVSVSMWHVGSWVLRLPLMFFTKKLRMYRLLPQPYLFGDCPWTEWKDKVIRGKKGGSGGRRSSRRHRKGGLYAGALGWPFKVPGRGLRGL